MPWSISHLSQTSHPSQFRQCSTWNQFYYHVYYRVHNCTLLLKLLYLYLTNLFKCLTPLKRSNFLAWLQPGKPEPEMLSKLNIPGIEITSFRTYQYRTKAWRVVGYSPSRFPDEDETNPSKEYRLNINGFKAWRIGLKNKHQTEVTIIFHFRIQGRYVPGYDYSQTCANLLPNQEEVMVVVPWMKTGSVRVKAIEVYEGSILVSHIELNATMPYHRWSFVYSFLLACTLGVSFLFISFNNKHVPVEHHTTTLVYSLGFFLAFWEVYTITPVIIMILLLILAPFLLNSRFQITLLMFLGCLYLRSVWRKRSSIKDFLIGAFIP